MSTGGIIIISIIICDNNSLVHHPNPDAYIDTNWSQFHFSIFIPYGYNGV